MDVVGYIICTLINEDDDHRHVIYTNYLNTFLKPSFFHLNFCAEIKMRIVYKTPPLYDRER